MQGFRLDNPLADCGQVPWPNQLNSSLNLIYDGWGAPGGLLRGLFEYDYHANSLRIRPHLPPEITRYVQKFPVWFGKTKIWISVTGTGSVTSVQGTPVTAELGKNNWIEIRPDGKRQSAANWGKSYWSWQFLYRPNQGF